MAESAASSLTTPHSIALVGNPNCGKTALFNLLTGARQKVANYAGVTVERKVGSTRLANGRQLVVVDLPGAYSLEPATPDEQVALEVILGRRAGEDMPDALVAVVDATNLRMNLRLVLALARLGRPMIVALNMADRARAKGLHIDVPRLAADLGCPVVETVAVRRDGHAALLEQLARWRIEPQARAIAAPEPLPPAELQREVRRILAAAAPRALAQPQLHPRLDAWVLHPVWGLAILGVLLFVVFQAVFWGAAWPMELVLEGVGALGRTIETQLAPGPLRSLLVDGAIAGAGSVLVFLPQILILFAFILALEDSGYLPRAAFLLDNLMGRVGLSGRAFIPLLSSFACAVPGIMATRTIPDWKDRLLTIMIAPLMTCSARLPVYALLIGAFVPDRAVGPLNLRGLVLFALFAAGVMSALAVAWGFKRIWSRRGYQPLMLELPAWRVPSLRSLAIGLAERAKIFVHRVGTIIFSLVVVLWFLASHPAPPAGAAGPAIQYSWAGQLGRLLEPLFAAIGFNWQISIALVPGMAAREVAVGALGTVYALSATGDAVAEQLGPLIARSWPPATGWALLAWYVFAPQCISTLAAVRRETGSWRWPGAMAAYLFALAWLAAFATWHAALALGV